MILLVTQYLYPLLPTNCSCEQLLSSELFLKKKLRTRFDLLKPDVSKSVNVEQAKQKNNHDRGCQSREYTLLAKMFKHTIFMQDHAGPQA